MFSLADRDKKAYFAVLKWINFSPLVTPFPRQVELTQFPWTGKSHGHYHKLRSSEVELRSSAGGSAYASARPWLELLAEALSKSYHQGPQGFFPGGGLGGPPHPAKILPIPPHPTLVPVFGPRLVPPPAEVRPRKFEKFKYIFVSNLTTFQLKSTLKSCISCLK